MGLGVMGYAMAQRLITAGHDLRVYNRSPEKAKGLGAFVAPSPKEAALGAEIVISMVSDDKASEEIWLGENGVLKAQLAHKAICIESSTISYAWVKTLNQHVKGNGYRYIDSPVTGGPDGAESGKLTMLMGGDEKDIEEAKSTLNAYASRFVHFGPVGAGTCYKLMVNLMGAVQGVALAEGMLLAEACGLDLQVVGETLKTGAVASNHVKYLIDRTIAENHQDIYFSAALRHKDAAYALQLAEEMGQSMPVSAVAKQIFQLALSRGWGSLNSSVVVEILRGDSHNHSRWNSNSSQVIKR